VVDLRDRGESEPVITLQRCATCGRIGAGERPIECPGHGMMVEYLPAQAEDAAAESAPGASAEIQAGGLPVGQAQPEPPLAESGPQEESAVEDDE